MEDIILTKLKNRQYRPYKKHNFLPQNYSIIVPQPTVTKQQYDYPLIAESNVIGCIMTTTVPIIDPLLAYGFVLDDVVIKSNLIWYMYMLDTDKRTFSHWSSCDITTVKDALLNRTEVAWLSKLSITKLNKLMFKAGNYKGAIDKASLLFAMVFGISVPFFTPPARFYKEIKHYPSDIVWYLCSKVFNIEHNQVNVLPPYFYLSFFPKGIEEELMLGVTLDNVLEYLHAYKITIPYGLPMYETKEQRRLYVINALTRYGPILSRGSFAPRLPDFPDPNNIVKELEIYTLFEIIEKYWIEEVWIDFDDLMERVVEARDRSASWIILPKPSRNNISPLDDSLVLTFGRYYSYSSFSIKQLCDEWTKNIRRELILATYPGYGQRLIDFPDEAPKIFGTTELVSLNNFIQGTNVPKINILLPFVTIFLNN